ncbi:MAG: lipopolysaccharide transport periplasmic protein LptA [Epsilonproteobacteria bacterium]|nr:lipopolysaccharide transport periplasmic protein LptA [Campylobacterota bacterium]
MLKFILFSLIPFSLFAAERVEVNANHFEADEFKKVSYFTGAVHIKKGIDEIKSDKLRINFDQNNKPITYEATGNIAFDITTENQHFEGTSNKLIYTPHAKQYTLSGNVYILELTKQRTLKGESIIIDRISGKSTISGTAKKPVKFIFTVDE